MKCNMCGQMYDAQRTWSKIGDISFSYCLGCEMIIPSNADQAEGGGYDMPFPVTGMVFHFEQATGIRPLSTGPYKQDPALVRWLKDVKERIEDVWHVARHGREYFDW